MNKKQISDMVEAFAVIMELKATEGRIDASEDTYQHIIWVASSGNRLTSRLRVHSDGSYSMGNKLLGAWATADYLERAIETVGKKRIIKTIKTLSSK